MRIISGLAKGRKLKTLEGTDVRPTTDRVKEGLFSSIQFDIPAARVLDLFAGSGQLGIEALSRGADFVVFNDTNRAAQQIIKENLQAVGFFSKARVIAMDAKDYLRSCRESFDIVFLDPPYHQDILPAILPLVAEHVKPNGVILCEHEKNEEVPEQIGDFVLHKQYRYGKILISAYRQPQA